jgi:hypothetical protein
MKVSDRFDQAISSKMSNKGLPTLFQPGPSRSEFTTAAEHHDVRTSHPWLVLTWVFFNTLLVASANESALFQKQKWPGERAMFSGV